MMSRHPHQQPKVISQPSRRNVWVGTMVWIAIVVAASTASHPIRQRKWKRMNGSLIPGSSSTTTKTTTKMGTAAANILTFQDPNTIATSSSSPSGSNMTTTTKKVSGGVKLLSWGRIHHQRRRQRQSTVSSSLQSSHAVASTTTTDRPPTQFIRIIPSQQRNKISRNKVIHSSLVFLEPPELPPLSRQQQQHQQQSTPTIKTRVGTLAQSFATVLTTTTSSSASHPTTTKMMIDMDQLLRACHLFEQAMVEVEQKLSARDLRNNIGKVESLYHQTSKTHQSMESILRYEKEQNIHLYDDSTVSTSSTDRDDGDDDTDTATRAPPQQQRPRPRLIALNEQSCAMGLLWIRRSLQFQYHLFQSLLQDVDATTATMVAYEQTLQPYHSWALQQVYHVAVKSATPSNDIWLARLGGYDHVPQLHDDDDAKEAERATREDLRQLLQIWGPLIQEWERIYTELNLEDQRRV